MITDASRRSGERAGSLDDRQHAREAATIARDGDNAFAWKVQAGKLQKTALKLGDRDPRRGEYEVLSGLAAGDQVLRYPTTTLHDGQSAQQSGAASAGK